MMMKRDPPSPLSQSKREQESKLWKMYASLISKEIGLRTLSAQVPLNIPALWGDLVETYSADIELAPDAPLEQHIPLAGAIAFACMNQVLSAYPVCDSCRIDMSLEFARQQLPVQESERWLNLWQKTTPKIQVPPNLVYYPSKYFSFLYSLTEKVGLYQLIRELTSLYRGDIELHFSDYVRYLSRRFRYFSTGIDKTEIKLIETFLNHPEKSVRDIAQELGMSPQWVSTKTADLKARGILRQFDWSPFSRINIRMFHVFLTGVGDLVDPLLLVRDSPFLYLFQNLITGHADALAIFCVPDNLSSIHALTSFERLAAKWNVDIELFEVVRSGRLYNLQFYDSVRKKWSIPWHSIQSDMLSVDPSLTSYLEMITYFRSRPQIRLIELDLQILNAVQSGISGVARIRQAVKSGQNIVIKRLRLLKRHGLIIRFSELHNVGLVERIVLQTEDRTAVHQLAYLSFRLPVATLSLSSENQLTVVLDLPAGDSTRLLRVIDSLDADIFTALLGEPLYGGWKIPLHLWNTSLQMWDSPVNQIRSWLDQLL
ncbi:MAG: winged helix-turn-helix transcriptional regulator [Candidatus Thorarchaeota archaeon]|nr:winged helix-turn-helix transcriptional regulator [Candidatus Thorarchaeota archaeon]